MTAILNGGAIARGAWGEQILLAGQRLVPTSAVLNQTSTALAPGRYIAKFLSSVSTESVNVRQSPAAAPVPATSAEYPLQHGQEKEIRVTGASDNAVTALFPSANGTLSIVSANERP